MADQSTRRIHPFVVLAARAEARALLHRLGEYESVEDAIAPLCAYALENGLGEQFGAATIDEVIRKPFADVTERVMP